jgi:hypothetical protein
MREAAGAPGPTCVMIRPRVSVSLGSGTPHRNPSRPPARSGGRRRPGRAMRAGTALRLAVGRCRTSWRTAAGSRGTSHTVAAAGAVRWAARIGPGDARRNRATVGGGPLPDFLAHSGRIARNVGRFLAPATSRFSPRPPMREAAGAPGPTCLMARPPLSVPPLVRQAPSHTVAAAGAVRWAARIGPGDARRNRATVGGGPLPDFLAQGGRSPDHPYRFRLGPKRPAAHRRGRRRGELGGEDRAVRAGTALRWAVALHSEPVSSAMVFGISSMPQFSG